MIRCNLCTLCHWSEVRQRCWGRISCLLTAGVRPLNLQAEAKASSLQWTLQVTLRPLASAVDEQTCTSADLYEVIAVEMRIKIRSDG